MFANFIQKLKQQRQKQQQRHSPGCVTSSDLNPRVTRHYGIPATASILAFDHVQRLLAVGTQDGRIKVVGGDKVEELLVSSSQSPIKSLEFLQDRGFLVTVSNDSEIQVWDLERRQIASTLRWENTVTAFSVVHSTPYMCVGSAHGRVSVLKFDCKDRKLVVLPYHVPIDVITEAVGILSLDHLFVVRVLPQACSEGNRLLIVYENGLLVLWDASESQVVLIRGHKSLELKEKDATSHPKGKRDESSDDNKEFEKEISSVCWVSEDGSIVAVGYVDGDMMLWDLSSDTSNNGQQTENSSKHAAKLELSSANTRLPVIVMHWSKSISSNGRGQLFVYGGDAIGSEEVLTILSLDWSSGVENLKCISCNKLKLNGAFADMLLLSSDSSAKSNDTMLFVLTHPGQLLYYNTASLSTSMNDQEKNISSSGIPYPLQVPPESGITTTKLFVLRANGKSSKILSEMVLAAKLREANARTVKQKKWTLTGGPSPLLKTKDYQTSRLYMAGYQDGSVQIWDATYTALTLVWILGLEVNDSETAGAPTSVSALEFCSDSLKLAVGKECGLVCLYELLRTSAVTNLKVMTKTKIEVKNMHQNNGPCCKAIFSILNSCVTALKFASFGATLAVGYECGWVAMLDVSTLSVLFLTETMPGSPSAVISIDVKLSEQCSSSSKTPNNSDPKHSKNHWKGLLFIIKKDARIFLLDGVSGKRISNGAITLKKKSNLISVCIIDENNTTSALSSNKPPLEVTQNNEPKKEHAEANAHSESTPADIENATASESSYVEDITSRLLILICCENDFRVYPLKSLIEGCSKPKCKMNFVNQCYWTTTFKKDEQECGLVAFYMNGKVEIRTLPTLELVGESSLGSTLRWDVDPGIKKTMCSSSYGQIILIKGNELAFLSLLDCENEFRIPESLPCLHDEVLAAGAKQEEIQESSSGFVRDVINKIKADKVEQNPQKTKVDARNLENLERIFSNPPFLKPWRNKNDELELSTDDIQIDEPKVPTTSTTCTINIGKKGKGTERQRLFEGTSTDTRPKVRTVEEIKAKYRKPEDASGAAKLAKDKLMERQEKLQMLSQHTEELENEATDFASMASELARRMENRKWWKIGH